MLPRYIAIKQQIGQRPIKRSKTMTQAFAKPITRNDRNLRIVAGKYFGNPTKQDKPEELYKVIEVDLDYAGLIPNTVGIPMITYEHGGGLLTTSEPEFKKLLVDNQCIDLTILVQTREKFMNRGKDTPDYEKALELRGKFIKSPDERYEAKVEEVSGTEVKVTIKVLGLDVESKFQRTYPIKGFSLDKIFSPMELNKLNAIYGTSSDETLLAIAVANKMDENAEKNFWHEVAERGHELGMSDELIQMAKNTLAMQHINPNEPCQGIQMPTEDGEFLKVTYSLFEVVGTHGGKDVKFTIVSEDIDEDLIRNIHKHKTNMEIFSIKRLSVIDYPLPVFDYKR